MIPYKSAKHQSGFSVPSKVLRFGFFLKRKQHFLRLGIRGLVVRLQQESTSEINNRLDNQISAVQSNSKSRSNLAREKILFIGIWAF